MIARLARRVCALRRDARGVTVVEFAIIAPVMLALIMGLCDLMYQAYVQSVLDGAMMKAGRDSALETNATNAAAQDAAVKNMVARLGPEAKFFPERKSYQSFSVGKPENFTDTNRDGVRNAGECYDDVNGNKQWDADPGRTGQGGANDVTKYTMRVEYPRLFPIAPMFGWPAKQTITATTMLKNQPYRTQDVKAIESICT
ncbi:hypothetical protein ASG29_12480 [Sphingomonas sp. Leaf412]|uniref:TadE/TadG family type IV pilus assembly protein n=1 Tax=Sphingomonas sp. Leaf412 TaxID=1736370 RepID=UPI0006F274E8|nr:TadE family protein [Sphingomonas sp. Leaf412]KQT32572.1 hypothetical protein ASG29_12480 [Sphingomonas sp. Leaf412]